MELSPEKPYRRYGEYLRARFASKVYKIPLHAGFTCPNLDGTLGRSGCIYCDNATFHPREMSQAGAEIGTQIRNAQAFLKRAFRVQKFIAYFQTFTNTYGPLETIRRLVGEALTPPDMVGVSVGTRPDCVSAQTLDFFDDLAQQTFVTLEYGLQSMHDRTLEFLRRGHGLAQFEKTIQASAGRRFEICVHVILGLPGESVADMMATADYVAGLPIHCVKIHNLYFARNTILGRMYERKIVQALSEEDYVNVVCDFLERLPARLTIQRLCADVAAPAMYGPLWCQDKPHLLRRIREVFAKRQSFQGCRAKPGCLVECSARQENESTATGKHRGVPEPASFGE